MAVLSATSDKPKGFEKLISGLQVIPAQVQGNDIWQEMQTNFSWCMSSNAELAGLAEISRRGSSKQGFHLPPLLLVGKPGCGKTRWARAAAVAAGVPFTSVSMAGAMSSVLVNGTERGWNEARAGMAALAMRDTDCANPLLLIDEVDKAGSNSHNGNPIEALLPLLERETAERFPDTYLLSPLDASQISYVLTANLVDNLPPALLSRVKVFEILAPPVELLAGVIESMRADIGKEWGMDMDDLPEIGGDDLSNAIRAYRVNPDLRPLRRRVFGAMRRGIWSPPGNSISH